MGGIRPDTPTNDRSTDLGSISSLLNEDHHTNTIGQSPSPRSTFGSDPTPMIQRQLIKNEDGVSPGSMGFSKNHQGYQKPRNGDRMEYEKAPYQRSELLFVHYVNLCSVFELTFPFLNLLFHFTFRSLIVLTRMF